MCTTLNQSDSGFQCMERADKFLFFGKLKGAGPHVSPLYGVRMTAGMQPAEQPSDPAHRAGRTQTIVIRTRFIG